MAVGPALRISEALAPFALSAFQRRRRVDWGGLQRWLGGLRAEGYVSPEDKAAAGLTEARLSRAATSTAAGQRLEANRRATQRGINTAPAMEATYGRIGQTEAGGRQAAADTAAEQEYSAFLGNKRFEQGKLMGLVGARLGDVARDQSRQDLQQSSFWNSLLEYAPTALDSVDAIIRSHPRGSAAVPRRYNHALGRFENSGLPAGDSAGGTTDAASGGYGY